MSRANDFDTVNAREKKFITTQKFIKNLSITLGALLLIECLASSNPEAIVRLLRNHSRGIGNLNSSGSKVVGLRGSTQFSWDESRENDGKIVSKMVTEIGPLTVK